MELKACFCYVNHPYIMVGAYFLFETLDICAENKKYFNILGYTFPSIILGLAGW